MSQVLKSLEAIATGYSVFEKDQVLTHDQLNSVAGYFDDQTRLTRVKLLGVGIVCGLRVSVQGGHVVVTKGAGVTTDGDLLYFAADTVFDQFKLYDESNPAYGPFHAGESLIKVYELVASVKNDPRATDLSQFAADTGSSLNNMVAVLFMEAYVKDDDLCSGTDCDNLGQDFVNNLKLLLVEKSSVGLLTKKPLLPNDAAAALTEIVADRPLFSSSVTTTAQLATVYRSACNSIHSKLATELPKLYPKCACFVGDALVSDPASDWIAKLNGFKAAFAASDFGIQYYYDFLKDLAETWNHFRDLLFGDRTWCCPDTDSFPKHLLLGNVMAAANPDENRTGFYPSPLASRRIEQLNHAQFLAQKLSTQIQTFQVPASTASIRVTPSAMEDRRLEERAIPYYYGVNETNPIQNSWSYLLHQRGMDAWNYSYNAVLYSAQGGAAHPLTSQIGRFQFFRIEGHLGQNVSAAVAAIESQISAMNLPFVVRSILLGPDSTPVTSKPGIRYSDLNRFHHLLRQDAVNQLTDVVRFNDQFKGQLDTKVAAEDSAGIQEAAARSYNTIKNKAEGAQAALNSTYLKYKANPGVNRDLSATITAAGEFKYYVGNVAKTEFTTPFDTLIASTHVRWLDWLDEIIQAKDQKDDNKLRFSTFASQNPGLEHFGGVIRGGTFVLVYDSSQNVVADFMLPCWWPDDIEPPPAEPPLKVPEVKPEWVVPNGIRIVPSLETFANQRLTTFQSQLMPQLDTKINALTSSFTTVANIFTKAAPPQATIDVTRPSTGPVAPVIGPEPPVIGPEPPVIGPVTPVIGPVTPVIGPVTPVIGPVTPVIGPVTPVIGPVTPVIGPVTPVIGPVTPVIGPVTPVIGPVTPVIGPVTPVIGPVTPVIGPVTPVIGPVTPVIGPVTPVIGPVTPVIGPVTPVIGPVTPVIGPVTPVIGPVTPVIGPVTPVIGPVTPVIGPRTPVIGPRTPGIGTVTPGRGGMIARGPTATEPITSGSISTVPTLSRPEISTRTLSPETPAGLTGSAPVVRTPTSEQPSASERAHGEFTDQVLGKALDEASIKQGKVTSLRTKLNQTQLPAKTKNEYKKQAKQAEADLVKSVQNTARYISESGISVSPGTEGFNAMVQLSERVKSLSDRMALASLKKALTTIRDTARNPRLKRLLNKMLNF